MSRHYFGAIAVLGALVFLCSGADPCWSQEQADAPLILTRVDVQKATNVGDEARVKADSAWMLMASALVMLMVPGLALFYGGMVRVKNVLATMMQSMVALAVVGVWWIAVGYALAFGDPWLGSPESSYLGWNSDLVFMRGVAPQTLLPGSNIPVYLHMLFQGMFAIITPALISGAVAERIRFKPYCLFLILWVTFVYCPLAHWVWAMNWNWADTLSSPAPLAVSGTKMVGWLGALGALDFAGGTVVHMAAGFSSLAAILLLRRRLGYPEHATRPNSMVLTLTGAGLLWFGWFGFNGGSAVKSGPLAVSAFAATQAAAAAAGLSWLLVEWRHRGKPTALGLASGIVAGLVAVTPASGFVFPWAGLVIGLIAGAVCYVAVALKPRFGYDDSLDAFGVHGVGGLLGALLTGVFCSTVVNDAGADGWLEGNVGQVGKQAVAAAAAAVFALVVSAILVKFVDVLFGFVVSDKEELEGLDRTEHGETGFDLSVGMDVGPVSTSVEPRPAVLPPNGDRRFNVVIEGVPHDDLIHVWSEMCQPGAAPPSADFKTVYPFLTTVQGNRFRFRGGDSNAIRDSLQRLFQNHSMTPVRAHVD